MRCSNTNIESKKTLMKTLVKLQKQSTKEYSPATVPKEPDKVNQWAENRGQAMGIVAISKEKRDDKRTSSRGHPYEGNDESHYSPEENVSEQMTAHNTPSMTQMSSRVPTTKHPMFTGTGKGSPSGHQVVVSPVQQQSPRRSNMNIKTKR
jgi:hypothetical protein